MSRATWALCVSRQATLMPSSLTQHRLECGHSFCFRCLDHKFSRILEAFENANGDLVPSITFRDQAAQILDLLGQDRMTQLPSNVSSVLMKVFIWFCLESPTYTCATCTAILSRPPVRCMKLRSVSSRLRDTLDSGSNLRDFDPPDPGPEHWEKYFPQFAIIRALFR